MSELRIGCSGWAYKDWKGPFYPADLKDKERLAFYATRFDTAEINASFYRLPSEKAVASWAEQAPAGFLFAWKASRYITHNKKLLDCEESIELVFGRMAGLGQHFGPVLFQLPPSLKRDDERLARFLGWLPKGRCCAFEFRHRTWYEQPVFDRLAEHGAAFVISDHHHAPAPDVVTAPLVYWRGHGPGGRYHGRYGDERLKALADKIADWRREGRTVHAYFDNDIKSAAPMDAEVLKALLKGRN